MSAPAEAVTERKRGKSLTRELIETAFLTVVLFLLVRMAIQNFRVDGNSMDPTLHNGEYVLVNKAEYWFRSPSRGDIVVFRAVPADNPDRDFIKRVIGQPGDTVAVSNHRVYVNGRALREPYIKQAPDYTFPTRRVPNGSYFVLGDNRNDSYDSSRWPSTPWLARKYIIGEAWISYWPASDVNVFSIFPLHFE